MLRRAEEARRERRLLARASFGPRPGEAAAFEAEGGQAWLARQLAPETIPDDEAESRVAALARTTLAPGDLDAPLRRPSPGRGEARSREQVRERRARLRRAGGFAAGARLLRAVYGRRELLEVMVDFWASHFSVSARKGPVAIWLDAYEREALRPHALGRFEDLLLAVARSPAMLFYLDNVRSGVPRATRLLGLVDEERRRFVPEGINENYARELLELHTLGVDGGYTQEDVVEAARILTGWSIDRRSPGFTFRPFLHDRGEKHFLGRSVPGSGEDEGRWLLRELARHPSTARFVSHKLARRFVCDEPPQELVERAAARWQQTGGSIAAVLRTILLSDELARPEHRKLKTPVELLASALRATGGETDGGEAIRRRLLTLGELPYLARTPEGHPDEVRAWATPSGMLGRIALAFELASDAIPGTRLGGTRPDGLDPAPDLAPPERIAAAVADPEFQWQ